ncbi:unnamed protein product [Adineta steineri]|uniref:G-protein coupled receptors family 1 profile domain-containing protein n=1 Tax=Adineta steineri TaxID=433720 RepID=A0A814KT89_9BILA|nr:unnamed protein product [Adineta steineri]CAF3516701.1 unnamed protein product [Adineta steineri]
MVVEQIFEGIIVFFSASSSLISFAVLLLIFIRVRPLASDRAIVLTCNTYITLFGSSFMTLLIIIYGIYGELHPSISMDDYNCQLRSYINYVFICSFYYSCALQATFRLFRVVFPKQRVLQSNYAFIIAIIIQWIIPILYILAYLLGHDFEYHPEINSCWLSFKNIRALSIAMAFVYGSPLIIMGLVYFLIIRHIRRTALTQRIRRNANKRDLLIVKRIILLVLIAMGIGIPTALLLIIYMISHELTSLAYHIQALSLTTGLVVDSIALAVITPQVRNIFRIHRQVNPATTIVTVQTRRTDGTAEN